jgi:hypothetical protein
MKKPINENVKFAFLWAFSGVAIGLMAFIFNYTMAPISLPGYELLAWPAMLGLQFFSEETAFWPKLLIFITSQYLLYFCVILSLRNLLRKASKVYPKNTDR